MRRYGYLLALFALLGLAAGAQSQFNVLSFGAKNDSSKLCTKAIADAIQAASKKGGGTVYFPAGKYLTGPIHLKSNITIFIEAGAELHFSDNFDHYLPFVETRYEGVDVKSFSPLFYAYKAENITITGRGLINGHGKKWWDFVEGYKADQPRSKWQYHFDSLNKNILLPDEPFQMKRGFLRPPFIQPMYCRNVRIEGITIINSPFWTVNPEFCENVNIDGVTINNPHSPNTDGINPESCRYVRIANCHISVGDDCITIKSGKDVPGRTKAAPAEDYTITNCTMLSGHGGVVIGSEMSGGVRRISISNCIFDGTDRGIRIKTARGRGGVVEDIRVSNVVMHNIRQQAIVLDMQYARTQPEPVSERTPAFRNIHFNGITADGNEAIFINGLAEMPVEGIRFTDIQFRTDKGITVKEAKDIYFNGVQLISKAAAPFVSENVNGLAVLQSEVRTTGKAPAAIAMTNVQNARFVGCKIDELPAFLMLKGAQTKNIQLANNFLSKGMAEFVKENTIADEAIQR
jgi:polygalacturonase